MERAPKRRQATLVQLLTGYFNILVTIVQGILLVPLYLKHIDFRLYGLWLATGGVTMWLGVFDFGVAGLMGQRVAAAYGRKDQEAIGSYYYGGIILQCSLVFLLLIAATMISWELPVWLKAVPDEVGVLREATFLACAATACAFINNGQKNTADALQRPLIPMLFLTGGNVLSVYITIVLLVKNYGLIAIPVGMLGGAIVALLGNFIYVSVLIRRTGAKLKLSETVLRDMLSLSPALMAAKTGNALVGRIEPTLISIMIKPEVAVAFTLTKRAADIIQMILDRFVGSVTAGFAHLFAENNMPRAREVLSLTILACFSVGAVCLSAYLAGNRSFIGLWVGAANFAGGKVTILAAAAALSLVLNNLASTLLGSTGDIAVPCWLQLLESGTRLGLMALLLPRLGIAGLPFAVLVSTGAFSIVYFKRLTMQVGMSVRAAMPRVRWPIVATLCCAAAAGAFVQVHSWLHFLLLALAMAIFPGVAILLTEPQLAKFRGLLSRSRAS